MRRPAPSPRMKRMKHANGFTLVEVLVALAIVTLGMAALLAALGSSADSATYQRDKTLAEWVALNRIEEERLALKRPTKGKTEGETEMAGVKWKWAEEVLETEVKGIMRIDVSARPSDARVGKDVWYTTVSAIVGDALAPARGDMDAYGAPLQPGPGGQGGGNNGGNNGGGARQPGQNPNPPPQTPNPNPNPGPNGGLTTD
jgi:general secretion pathway protein I